MQKFKTRLTIRLHQVRQRFRLAFAGLYLNARNREEELVVMQVEIVCPV